MTNIYKERPARSGNAQKAWDFLSPLGNDPISKMIYARKHHCWVAWYGDGRESKLIHPSALKENKQ